jgi:hypothetical protein
MSWLLQAAGHVVRDITDEATWAKVEDELAAELHAVLSNPKYGTSHSLLGLRLVQGAVHLLDTPLPKGAPADPNAPGAAPVSSFLTPEQLAHLAANPPAPPVVPPAPPAGVAPTATANTPAPVDTVLTQPAVPVAAPPAVPVTPQDTVVTETIAPAAVPEPPIGGAE